MSVGKKWYTKLYSKRLNRNLFVRGLKLEDTKLPLRAQGEVQGTGDILDLKFEKRWIKQLNIFLFF